MSFYSNPIKGISGGIMGYCFTLRSILWIMWSGANLLQNRKIFTILANFRIFAKIWCTLTLQFYSSWGVSDKMCACKFGRVIRLFWDWGPMDHKNVFFLSFTLSYGLPEPSMEPAQRRFRPTFLAEMRYPILPALWLAREALNPVPKQSMNMTKFTCTHLWCKQVAFGGLGDRNLQHW